MEKPKPAQNHEQERPKTLEDYAVKTFPADLDVTIRPLTVIRSGKDGGGIRDDEGWTPGDMLCVRKEGIGSIELFVKVHKLTKVYGEHVYEECVPITKIVSLKKLQSREENKGFNEFYIQELYGKSTEEMIEEGERAAEKISNSSVVEEGGSDLERPKVSLKIGSTAVEAAGIKKPTNEPVRESVEKDKTGVGSPALKIPEPTMELIGATEVNGSVGSPAVESAKKPAEIDKAGANPADLPASKSVENPVAEKPMETNETNADILPESFKDAINRFKQLAEENNGKFFAKAQYIAGKLDQLRQQIQINPAVIYGLDSEGLLTAESSIIRDLEASRAEDANKFKNDVSDLIEELKKKIENDDERSRLVKLTKHVDKMGENNIVLGRVTKGLLDKLIRIRSYIAESQSSSWGIDYYKSSISQMINEIISDLSTASGRRWSIVGGIEGIKSEGYCQKR